MKGVCISIFLLLVGTLCFAQDEVIVDENQEQTVESAAPVVKEHKEHWENGQVRVEGQYSDELRVGEWKYYFKNGQLSEIGNYEEGQKTGEWKCYHYTGELKEIGNYEPMPIDNHPHTDGVMASKTGLWRFYYDNGQERKAGSYEKGQKAGEWKYYYPDGELEKEGNYVDYKKVGEWKHYYPTNDSESSSPVPEELEVVLMNYLVPDGYSINMETGQQVNIGFIVKNTGKLKLEELTLKDSKSRLAIEGGPIVLNPGKEDTSSFRAVYKLIQEDVNAGEVLLLKDIELTAKDELGNIIKCDTYGNMQLVPSPAPRMLLLTENAARTLWEESNYTEEGLLSGSWKIYYTNGKVKEEGTYNNGNRVGTWKFYDEEGELKDTVVY